MKLQNREVAICIIFDKQNRILLQKKTLDYKYYPNGPWLLPGGKLEKNELPEKTIMRELEEEFGNNFYVKFFKTSSFTNPLGFNVKEHVFISKFNGNISQIRLSEGIGFAFFDISELDSINISPFHLNIIKEYINNK